jgi:hypothetical protein
MNMAHHHHSPNQPQIQGKEPGNFKVHTSSAATPAASHSSREVEKEAAPPHKAGKSIFDYQIAGFPWPFLFVVSLIAVAVLGLVLRVMGMF